MHSSAGASITDDLLKTLFLQRLPVNVQAILSISSENIDCLSFNIQRRDPLTLQNQISKLSNQIASMQFFF